MGAQYLNRFLRDIGSFNLGVPARTNDLGNNIGAEEVAAPAVVNGVLQPPQDALGRDYNGDGKGNGFNVPSLLGIHAMPPFLHNGAAESLAAVLADSKHRTANGTLPDRLSDPSNQLLVVKFLESIDASVIPFCTLESRIEGQSVILSFDSTEGGNYAVEACSDLGAEWSVATPTVKGTGQRMSISFPIDTSITPTNTLRNIRIVRLIRGQ